MTPFECFVTCAGIATILFALWHEFRPPRPPLAVATLAVPKRWEGWVEGFRLSPRRVVFTDREGWILEAQCTEAQWDVLHLRDTCFGTTDGKTYTVQGRVVKAQAAATRGGS